MSKSLLGRISQNIKYNLKVDDFFRQNNPLLSVCIHYFEVPFCIKSVKF